MPVKNFKFVSPGVFIHEIDNSFRPREQEGIGPVVIGRAPKGRAMEPVKFHSYSDFVEMYGNTVPGDGGGDIYREGNYQSPMYGLYAARAHLVSQTTPLTYIRLLGTQHTNATAAGYAGWKTAESISGEGGAYGLFVFPSGSGLDLGNGRLAAIWYLNTSASIELTGAVHNGGGGAANGQGIGKVVIASNGEFTAVVSSSVGSFGTEKITFNFDDSSAKFVRKAFNTNPHKIHAGNLFYPVASIEPYWLGESFEQSLRFNSLVGSGAYRGVILPLAQSGAASTSPAEMQSSTNGGYKDAAAGWFIGQDLSGDPTSFAPQSQQKLFKLIGLQQGEWTHKNLKVTIANIKRSVTTENEYGTFSVIIRQLGDTDNNQMVMERYDNLNLNPASPDYIAARIGDQYYKWDSTERMLKLYGDFPNRSKFIRVLMKDEVDNGAVEPSLLPFGFFGAPKFKDVTVAGIGSAGQHPDASGKLIFVGKLTGQPILSGSTTGANSGSLSGSLLFPSSQLRVSASDAGLSDQRDVSFGFLTTRAQNSTRNDVSVSDLHRMLLPGLSGEDGGTETVAEEYSYVFSLNDIITGSSTAPHNAYYKSGSRKAGNSVADYETLLNLDIDSFTAPFWGGFDGVDITRPDPFYNKGIESGTETTNYAYNTIRRAIDTISDPEFVDIDMAVIPGLTNTTLTENLIEVCENRADAMALIDLPSIYTPKHEEHKNSKFDRVGSATVKSTADDLRGRRINSSYGATFYPWVQTRDEESGKLLWVPPSVVVLGVLASSAKESEIWYAPAGFNRGGLSDGAAGIPVTSVSRRVTSKERDVLYSANINPIASFPSNGIVLFGQKTLQETPSALDRINVRRLVLFLKKQISILSTQILFEQNVVQTWERFESLVEPLLANTKARFGISEYRLFLDETTTTPDVIDQNAIYAKIMVKPVKSIEFIAIDFVIASQGASFDD